MGRRFGFLVLCTVLICSIQRSPILADDPDKNEGKVIMGILFDRKDNELTIKRDGSDIVEKIIINKDDKNLAMMLKSVFPASRVQFKYKRDGENMVLVGIARHIPSAQGTITGTVVKVHNDFWVEVKPKTGYADAFAPGGKNYNDKEFMARLKALKPGDSVTIQYTTDSERHRIAAFKVNENKDK
jgi:hypothetical protein